MSEQFRGVYAIPPTPFTDDDRVDEASLRRCVDFCVENGADGIVAPVNASEGPFLTDGERRRVVEIVVEQTNRRVPVVAGVSAQSTRASVEYARQAEEAGADSVMAMPPFVRHPSADEIPPFYDSLLGKIIVHGRDRGEAIARMRRALAETLVQGVKTTIPFHLRLLAHPAFVEGRFTSADSTRLAG